MPFEDYRKYVSELIAKRNWKTLIISARKRLEAKGFKKTSDGWIK